MKQYTVEILGTAISRTRIATSQAKAKPPQSEVPDWGCFVAIAGKFQPQYSSPQSRWWSG